MLPFRAPQNDRASTPLIKAPELVSLSLAPLAVFASLTKRPFRRAWVTHILEGHAADLPSR